MICEMMMAMAMAMAHQENASRTKFFDGTSLLELGTWKHTYLCWNIVMEHSWNKRQLAWLGLAC